jgi:Holliday junction DNA helicase RuvB
MLLGLLDTKLEKDDKKIDRALRPQTFDDYIGQAELIKKLKVAIEAANQREEAVDHMLFTGGPGLGKTTIASILASECKAGFRSVMGPSIKNVADMLSILSKLKKRDILFIDECHRIDKRAEECLYTAMEDYSIDVKLKNDEIMKIPIQPFCLVGATSLPGKMSAPLRDRFGISYHMEYYNVQELAIIISANARKLDIKIEEDDAIINMASRSRGIPRIANRVLRRVRDYSQVKNNNVVNNEVVDEALKLEGIDKLGLTESDRKYISVLFHTYNCGPCGAAALAASIGEDISTVVEFIEPYLVRIGFIARQKTGRVLTGEGMRYVLENQNI